MLDCILPRQQPAGPLCQTSKRHEETPAKGRQCQFASLPSRDDRTSISARAAAGSAVPPPRPATFTLVAQKILPVIPGSRAMAPPLLRTRRSSVPCQRPWRRAPPLCAVRRVALHCLLPRHLREGGGAAEPDDRDLLSRGGNGALNELALLQRLEQARVQRHASGGSCQGDPLTTIQHDTSSR